MRQVLFFAAITFVLASCSQKQFAFRKTVKAEAIAGASVTPAAPQVHRVFHPAPVLMPEFSQKVPVVAQRLRTQATGSQPLLSAAREITPTPDDTIRRKYNFDDKPKPGQQGGKRYNNADHNTQAILGFVFGILSFLLFPLFAIPGLILSAKGMDSEYRVLAIIGYILSLLVIVLMIVLLALLILFIGLLL